MLANVGIERAVISALCQYGVDALVDIEDIGVDTNSFTVISNQALFSSIKHLINNGHQIDQALLLITIKDLGYSALFESKKDIEYIGSLFNFPIKHNSIRELGIRLEKLAITRKAIRKHREAIESLEKINGSEEIDHIIQLSENPIFDLIIDLNKNRDSGPQLLFDNIEEIIQSLRDNPIENVGIPTPWSKYNGAIGGGLRRGGVNLIGARPKIGKTTLAKEALLHFTTNVKIPALFLDTEMVKQDQSIRSLASTSGVTLKDIETGKFASNHLFNQKIDEAVQLLKGNKFLWYESIYGKPFEEILAIIRRWVMKNVGFDENGNIKNCVVVYDYFKLMDRNQLDNLQEYQAMGFQISRLTDFCKEFDFPCLAFVQLNRQNDISQSDRLRWLCHSYGTFEKKLPQEQMDDGTGFGNRKLKLLDTRFGPGIEEGDYVCMDFNRDINRIREICLKTEISQMENTSDGTFELQENEQPKEPDDAPWL